MAVAYIDVHVRGQGPCCHQMPRLQSLGESLSKGGDRSTKLSDNERHSLLVS